MTDKEQMGQQTQTQAQAQEIEELKRKLQEKEEQLKSYIDRLKHLQADFENYKKRVAKEQENLAYEVENRLLLKILPIYDNLELAFRSLRNNNDKDSFIEGLEHIFAQFHEFLNSCGIKPIEAVGRPFDPALHEALLSVETDDQPNIVLGEFERGYRRGLDVLRPSRVKVSRKRLTAEGGKG